MNLTFPFQFDARGRTTAAADDDHIKQMIEQLLLTAPNERVNRPDFGSGLLQLTFEPNSDQLAATLQFTMQAALQKWLGDVIILQNLQVTNDESVLNIQVIYTNRLTQQQQTARFTSPAL
jgi:phage baseplate assembly protein W